MSKIYFVIGSQDLYGEATLLQVKKDGEAMEAFFNETIKGAGIVLKPVIRCSEDCERILSEASYDNECVGVLTWMHTFSPAKMWIRGLKKLNKPMLHLHTQFNERLPYDAIDMDFMNLNQSAHGDREFGFICTRMNVQREVVAGYYKRPNVIKEIQRFVDVAIAIEFSKHLRVAMFGNNMRDVAVTDGDRVESEIKYGWNVNYYGVGDLVDEISKVSAMQLAEKMAEYKDKYVFKTDNIKSVEEQAKYEIALEHFIKEKRINAITDTFEDLHGLAQLPGLAIQDLMSKGVGFGPEGDYKTSAMMAVLCKMSENRVGATAFLEDYTYDLALGNELELASHMLEVSPVFAKNKPTIEVHPLGIGGKADPARLVFDGIEGKGIAVSMIDLGDRFRIICADIELVKQPEPMPKLPVARVMWKILPSFEEGSKRWIMAGGAHHAVVSTCLDKKDIELFARLTNSEVVFIG